MRSWNAGNWPPLVYLVYWEETTVRPSDMTKCLYPIHLEPEPEGGFTVTVPALPGCVTWGEDYEQALTMAQEAIEVYLEVLVEDGKPIPPSPVTSSIDTLVEITPPAMA